MKSLTVETFIKINRFKLEFSHEAFFLLAVCSWDRPQRASGSTEEASAEETGSWHGGCHRHGHGGAVQRRRPGLHLSTRRSRKPWKQTDSRVQLAQPLGESLSSLIQEPLLNDSFLLFTNFCVALDGSQRLEEKKKRVSGYIPLWLTSRGVSENRSLRM